jgi:EF hand
MAASLAFGLGVRADDKPGAGKPGAGKPGAGKPGGGMMLAKLFVKADANGDGKVSLEEFKKAIANAPQGRLKDHPEAAERLFKRVDANGDGFVTQDEIKKASEQFAQRAKDGGRRKPGEKKADQ